jgi:hypothetical protein
MRLIVAASILACATPAAAECMIQRWAGSPEQAPIPPHGSLYINDELLRFGDDDTLSVTFPTHVTQTRVSASVIRIDYAGKPGDQLTVALNDPVTFTLGAARRHAPPHILQYWHYEMQWTCSHADALMVQLDRPVAAVRTTWTRGPVTETYVIPPRNDIGKTVVEIGKPNCAEPNIDSDELRLGGHLALVAIDIDGTETPLAGLPDELSTDNLASDDTGLEHAMTITPYDDPEPMPQLVTAGESERDGGTIAIVALVIVTALGLGLAMLLRTPREIH